MSMIPDVPILYGVDEHVVLPAAVVISGFTLEWHHGVFLPSTTSPFCRQFFSANEKTPSIAIGRGMNAWGGPSLPFETLLYC